MFGNAADRHRGILDVSQESFGLFPDVTKQLRVLISLGPGIDVV